MAHIWVRSEQRKFEHRAGITPSGVTKLLNAGHQVSVEKSPERVIDIARYAKTGCHIVAQHSWVNAPQDAIIFGLKELDQDGPDLIHRHIMFGHAYKGQSEGFALLNRFKRGGGLLYDLEYLLDDDNRRIATFGYWAGFTGAAIGLMAWLAQQKNATMGSIPVYQSGPELLSELQKDCDQILKQGGKLPSVIIIGAKGRVGSGALKLSKAMMLETLAWDIEQTRHGGPFPQILEHSIFINCVLASPDTPQFFKTSNISSPRKLSVIADISCDPTSPYNPIPVYNHSTTFSDPVIRIAGTSDHLPDYLPNYLDVIAIDNLPSMLPVESSYDYAEQLLPFLMQLDHLDKGVWVRAFHIFKQYITDNL